MKITIDYDTDEQRTQGEALLDRNGKAVNAGVFPLTFANLENFALCGDRTVGAPVVHMHGNFASLVCQTAALKERLSLALMGELVNSVRVVVKEQDDVADRPAD